jgi:hypothetical protein
VTLELAPHPLQLEINANHYFRKDMQMTPQKTESDIAPIAPRGLSIRQAAAYYNVSVNTFKKLIDLGHAPPPLKIPGVHRAVFDRLELDRAMDAARSETAAA